MAETAKLERVFFKSGKDMLDYLCSGIDLYSPTEQIYVFNYNEDGNICAYKNIDLDKAVELETKASKDEEYWGAYLGWQGSHIYDNSSYENYDDGRASNIEWCNEMYGSFWLKTTDVLAYADFVNTEPIKLENPAACASAHFSSSI